MARLLKWVRHAERLPDFLLPVLGFLPRLLLVVRNGERPLAVRRSTQSVPPVRPEVERRGVGDDLCRHHRQKPEPGHMNRTFSG